MVGAAMKKSALKKEFVMEIKKSVSRFLSILFIVALGVAFFSGIQSTAPDMRYSADEYFDQHGLADLKVISTLGLTQENIETLSTIEGVEAVYPGYMTDVLCGVENSEKVLHVECMFSEVNGIDVIEGELPQKEGECFLDARFAEMNGYELGDILTFSEGKQDGEKTLLKGTTYTVCGIGSSSAYISFDRGSTTLGTGEVSGFVYVLPENFDSEVYSCAYLTVEGARDLTAYTEEYDECVQKVRDILETETQRMGKERYEEILSEAKGSLANANRELASGKRELQSEIDDVKEQIRSGRLEILEGEKAIWDGEQELAEAKEGLADSQMQILAKQIIAAGEEKINNGKIELADGQRRYAEGKSEAERQIEEAQETILDGEQKIADAQREIDEIEEPTWYVWNRDNAFMDYTSCGENAERMRNIGEVFPVIFFLVAALVSLTTMTRMVEEERTQIGTLKALGYGKMAIMWKYLGYAFLATILGSVLGILVGEKILPFIIIYAYGIMFPYMDSMVIPYNIGYGLIASIAALVCTMGATLASCYRELADTPAVLMRPPAPKQGKRVWLEYLPFLWKRLNFTWKSTVRNLFRYKKRFFMTILGIGGSMAMMLVGFGLRDSIMDIVRLQYKEIQLHDGMAVFEEDSTPEEREQVIDQLAQMENIEGYGEVLMKKITLQDEKKSRDVYLFVLKEIEDLDQFVKLRSRTTKEAYTLDDEGIILTEKIAKLLGVSVGDTVMIEDGGQKTVEVKISHIAENYLQHYLYMTPSLYEKLYGQEPEYNSVLFQSTQKDTETRNRIGEKLLQDKNVVNLSYTASLEKRVNDMLGSLDIVIIVLIVSAGMLAFVVLYNLNNVNINERKRELATLKVLGFYDAEVSSYVYRENILLTIIGAVVGVGLGIFLHRYIVVTVEIDMCMFGRNIEFASYVFSVLFTFAFSMIVNVFMHFKLKKIDMVESLKSVE